MKTHSIGIIGGADGPTAIFATSTVCANCNNKLSIQLVRSLLFEEDPAQLRREP